MKVQFSPFVGYGWLPKAILTSDLDSVCPTVPDTPLETKEFLQMASSLYKEMYKTVQNNKIL